MMPMILLMLQAVVVIVGTFGFSWWVGRRVQVGWKTWGWGALAFVGSQAARIPLLLAFSTLFIIPQGSELSQDQILRHASVSIDQFSYFRRHVGLV